MSIDTSVDLLRQRRTKIVATVGPSSNSQATIEQLIAAGVNVFRLNMSHGDHAGHRENYDRLRQAASKAGMPIAILADLCGPKIRVGKFRGGSIELENGTTVIVTVRDVIGEKGLIPSQYRDLATDLEPGARILLADGVMELKAEKIEGTEVHCRVVEGGVLSDRKGINLPDVSVSAPPLTEKDRVDAKFALDLGVDFLALSFVRQAADVEGLKELIADHGNSSTAVIAKIERPEALDACDEIIAAADGIMVARGDLGVELPPEHVPVAQRALIDQARNQNKPVIVATQMLESMIDNARPTRAEVADVSHAVACGADAVMLSAETAAGSHPVAAVKMMDRIARQTEAYMWHQEAFDSFGYGISTTEPPLDSGDALARSTAQLSRDLMVHAIVVISSSGTSTATVAAARPAAPVIAVADNSQTCRRTNLLWGVIPVEVSDTEIKDEKNLARKFALQLKLAQQGDYILLVQGFSDEPHNNSPSVTIVQV